VREQLFAATERVLARDGAAGLTSRAITNEAGVAKGLIYRHFADFDEFLTEFLAEQARTAQRGVAELPSRAGQDTVADNLTGALVLLFGPDSRVPVVSGIIASRPSLAARLPGLVGASTFGTIEASLTAYLDAEQRLGRIAPDAQPQASAAALIGAVHHLVFTGRSRDPDFPDRVRDIVGALIAGLAPRA
jgi:AcrR family transcriptional regulator